MENKKDAVETILEGLQGELEIQEENTPEIEKTYFTDVIVMDDDAFNDFCQSDEFQEGLRIGAKYAGVYTAMVNAGAEVNFAQDIAFNTQMADIGKMNGEIQKDIATVTSKNVMIASEKNQL